MSCTPEFLIGIFSIALPAIVSLLVAVLTVHFEHRNAEKEIKHSRLLEIYELGLRLFAPAPEGFLAMAEKQYACDLIRFNSLARAYCGRELAATIDDFVQQYLRSYKIMVCNLLITEDAWSSTDQFEDSNGNPVQVEHCLLEERGKQEYKREIERIRFEFAESMAKLAKKQSGIAEKILAEMVKL